MSKQLFTFGEIKSFQDVVTLVHKYCFKIDCKNSLGLISRSSHANLMHEVYQKGGSAFTEYFHDIDFNCIYYKKGDEWQFWTVDIMKSRFNQMAVNRQIDQLELRQRFNQYSAEIIIQSNSQVSLLTDFYQWSDNNYYTFPESK